MNGLRLTTGIGIAIGGVGGALVALLGGPKAAPVAPPPAPRAKPAPPASSTARAPASAPEPAAALASAAATTLPSATASAAAAAAASTPAAPLPSATLGSKAAAPATVGSAPALESATTREALLKSEMLCDQKQDFDECERAAESLEKGTTGSADAEQAKRFRRIALTHLVKQCEGGSPHACFVMAGKYRAGSELAANPTSAEALEKRGLDLCRMRSAPECPSP
ncbi:MAG TPA: hypothetical protein VNG33_06800 [Polyangiaceae bacterium]|nr:hypothetical protein [Polyangiaceae bacterium]